MTEEPTTSNQQPTSGNRQPATDKPLPPDLRYEFLLVHPEFAIRDVILLHEGAAQAITIEGIALDIWRTQWGFVRADSKGFPIYPYRKKIQRVVKACVRHLRRMGLKIASGRGANAGYYMIQTADELAKTVRPMLNQAIDELKTIEALTGRGYYSAELEGQMALFGPRETGHGTREKLDPAS
jgi:hypothetical protein